jgi:hypothetical protein
MYDTRAGRRGFALFNQLECKVLEVLAGRPGLEPG